MENEIEAFQKLLSIKGYSTNTIKTYISCLLIFKDFAEATNWKALHSSFLTQKCFELFQHKKMSYPYQKQMIGSIQLFYRLIFNREVPLFILKNTRKAFKLPVVLSKPEVIRLLRSVKNLKHRAILTTI